MNKAELIEVVTNKAKNCSKAETARMIDTFIDSIIAALKKGDKVAIAGFGTFSVKLRKARAGINPKTQVKIQIPSMKVPKFKAGKEFKTSVR
ncbi:MAG: HU family DNA-binding protein [Patescibacteria group bacterium]|nr:HU family DNA-binding protein [Patescibacteria group bacterium]MDD5164095.1 HU family DNA-binding protein [Patescibacteria group bacterium]MDD5534247.1 HU family DNA-binding protein [Patescibacteria group bacterium]